MTKAHEDPRRRVVVIGDALIDELHGETGISRFVGGAALNVAVGLSRLGVESTLIAMVGQDADGDVIRAYLEGFGVKFLFTPSPLGTMIAVSERIGGEPRYRFNESARTKHIVFGAEERAAIAAADLVAVSCFPFDNTRQSELLLQHVADASQRLIIDPNPRPAMISDAEVFRENFEKAVRTSLLTKVSDEDAHYLRAEGLEDFASRLLGLGTGAVLATAGAQGAFLSTATGIRLSTGVTRMDGAVIDTMGAGDSMLASSIATMLERDFSRNEESYRSLICDALRIAAATVRSRGALLQLGEGE